MTIELRIDETSLETFCRKLISRSRDIAKTQDSLATLESFIAVFGKYFRFIDRLLYEIKVRYFILAVIIIIAAGWAVTLARALAASNSFQ